MIPATWLHTLRLEHRKPPEFICADDDLSGLPHSSLIRQSFEELNLSAVHCISGVPSIAFLVQDEFDQAVVEGVHKALWNQGLGTLLLVISDKTLRAYSLSQLPAKDDDFSEKLVQVFSLVKDALVLKDLVLGMESGRFVADHEEKFDPKYRVDQVLLENLEATAIRLVDNNMMLESAQALLMQIMFIAYLEDREIIGADYFRQATGNKKIDSLKALLNDGRVNKFLKLFKLLKHHFNGDLFIAPCAFDENEDIEELNSEDILILSEFRAGNVHLKSGQYQFWPYNFKYIPIDLISAVYDRFLGFDPTAKRETGAYYTPMFLADLVAEQAWSELSDKQKSNGKYVDPSCGSGIFLVRIFEKMVDEWRTKHRNQRPSWPSLLALLKRLHGIDIKREAVHVAAFSLYIALLENTRPSEILALMEKGRLLPKLFGQTLHVADFFEIPCENNKYDLIIGNPPWVSRRGKPESAEKWCKQNKCSMPAKEIAWGFAWKALMHTNQESVIALLLKATSFLTNHSPTFIKTRRQWMESIHLVRVINFADTCFQLFEGGDAPAALMLYKPKRSKDELYSFDYWVPKADLNLKTKRLMTLSSIDQAKLPIDFATNDQLLMKRRMWMQTPDAKLFQYINGLPKLSDRLLTYQESKRYKNNEHKKWVIGQGFIPAQEDRLDDKNYKTSRSKIVKRIPHLPTNMYQPLVMPKLQADAWRTDIVYRKGFEDGFFAPHILIPQGIERNIGRLRASYCTQDLTFRHSIQGISFDRKNAKLAKFLTVLLNSSLTAWFLFHHSSNTGMERDKVHQEQLLDIPFPSPDQLSGNDQANRALNEAVRFIDKLLSKKDDLLKSTYAEFLPEIDKIVYQYFGLNENEVLLIEDSLNHIIPSMQPRAHSRSMPSLWKDTTENDWNNYAHHLSSGLSNWINKPYHAITELTGSSSDLVVLGVRLSDNPDAKIFSNNRGADIDQILPLIWKSMPEQLPGNFQLIPDLRIFIDDVLYLVKPRKRRFWLGSTALADADAIAADLLGLAK
ncbi:MAG: N-6 DNA methylase [Candidatus Thiodiazotropha sp. (ex Lucina aurantia)]|nr:N-6 DNA methylase [Candidatus Thiodiazotropha sp. (ex Lucina pensylvanica)]MBT3024685.1 N-6 DNA methylase [Candidatus Thiodiazotropha taylori]MBV2098829.1 N-6 DNA methylase [Candidatus Thiodiazotropha sp. (ex Codakia orbicularis)]MBV2103855.1 N-6 DNA methylase [Candidatus Thiodiazotropha sp. (ex Lucina aurantia)]MBV2118274.1 N-6 DNA methylase [Candidatus Thiodiazotropha sp. (ex Lucina aurantia)]